MNPLAPNTYGREQKCPLISLLKKTSDSTAKHRTLSWFSFMISIEKEITQERIEMVDFNNSFER